MLGSVTEKLLRKAHCPVLAVRNPPHNFVVQAKDRNAVEMRRILFCTDFSEYSIKALDYALSLTVKYNSELALVHVLEDISESTRASQIANAKENLGRLISEEVKTKQAIEPIVRVGRADEEINRLARGNECRFSDNGNTGSQCPRARRIRLYNLSRDPYGCLSCARSPQLSGASLACHPLSCMSG